MRPLLLASLLLIPPPAHAAESERLTQFRAPAPLAADAVTESWPRFLGPHDNASTRETPIDWTKIDEGPIWEIEIGESYACVAVKDGVCYLFHRDDDHEITEARRIEDGSLIWDARYPVEYADRYGYNNGPRAGPVLAGDRLFTYGVTGILTCRNQTDGEIVWQHDLQQLYGVEPGFFGVGASPLAWKDRLFLNVGGSDAQCVVAFDQAIGEEIWVTRHPWGASYASPIITKLHGQPRLLVFAGGESNPATGGLLCIDPENGHLFSEIPWRADKYESVNAATPVAVDDRHVFITETYGPGGAMIAFDPEWNASIAWEAPRFAVHMMTPVLAKGYLYGFEGRHQLHAELVCLRASDGEEQWRDPMRWPVEIDGRTAELGLFRACFLRTPHHTFALGETGIYSVLDLSPDGPKIEQRGLLFHAPQAWTPPALSHGLLFIQQNERDRLTGKRARIQVFDVRGEEKP